MPCVPSCAETLGEELGLYEQPTDKLGQLSMEAIRSCQLVVDTGMHALGWSRDRAFAYMMENTAMGEHDAATERNGRKNLAVSASCSTACTAPIPWRDLSTQSALDLVERTLARRVRNRGPRVRPARARLR